MYYKDGPIIVQSDFSILVEVSHPLYEEVRDKLLYFAELVKSPDIFHTYKITSVSLWNASAFGFKPNDVRVILDKYSRYPINDRIYAFIEQEMSKYGKVIIENYYEDGKLLLRVYDATLLKRALQDKGIREHTYAIVDENTAVIDEMYRGRLKERFVELGYPVKDLAGYRDGEFLDIRLRERTLEGKPFALRKYQEEAVAIFEKAGAGVVVLPCGAGKTIVGIGVMSRLKRYTLIFVTNHTALVQWKNEILDKTYITEDMIGEYSKQRKEIKPITITTYSIITQRNRKGNYHHFDSLNRENWGLIIYDEVHTLPAPMFKLSSELQSKRRLGLTATLIREDGKEKEVFALIGPKRYDIPWKTMEDKKFIAKAICYEVRVPLSEMVKDRYLLAKKKEKYRIVAENPEKLDMVKKILERHKNDKVLIIGHFISQLKQISKVFKIPLITGDMLYNKRIELFEKFKKGEINRLVVSRVANYAVNLPDANVAIEVSFLFGSRQEEAQRLGRILRPKEDDNKAYFYIITTKDTEEEEFSEKRKLFLIEQGYEYIIQDNF